MNSATVRFGMLFVCLFSAARCEQAADCSQPDIDQSLSGTQSHNVNIIEAALMIGRKSNTCFGIDIRDSRVLENKVDVPNRVSVRQLMALFGRSVSYSVGEDVIAVKVGENGPKDWLDITIPVFKSLNAPPEVVGDQVSKFLYSIAHPGPGGTIGSISVSDNSGEVRAFVMKNASVRDLLTAILTNSSQSAMWFTTRPHPAREPLPRARFWTIVPYSESPAADKFKLPH